MVNRATPADAGAQRQAQGNQLHPGTLGPSTRYLEDAAVPIDYNWVENRTRPIGLGRSNGLFAVCVPDNVPRPL